MPEKVIRVALIEHKHASFVVLSRQVCDESKRKVGLDDARVVALWGSEIADGEKGAIVKLCARDAAFPHHAFHVSSLVGLVGIVIKTDLGPL